MSYIDFDEMFGEDIIDDDLLNDIFDYNDDEDNIYGDPFGFDIPDDDED